MAWLLSKAADTLKKAQEKVDQLQDTDFVQKFAEVDFVQKARDAANQVAEAANKVSESVQAEYRRTFEELDCQIYTLQPDLVIMEYPAIETIERLAKRLNESYSQKMLIFDFSEEPYESSKFDGEIVGINMHKMEVPPLSLACCDPWPLASASAIRYFHQFLEGTTPQPKRLRLSKALLSGVPSFEAEGSVAFRPFIEVWVAGELAYSSFKGGKSDEAVWPSSYASSDSVVAFPLPGQLVVSGDVLIQVFHLYLDAKRELAMKLAFHTNFVTEGLQLSKFELDAACNDDRFTDDFFVDLVFEEVPRNEDSTEEEEKAQQAAAEDALVFEKARVASAELREQDEKKRAQAAEAQGAQDVEAELEAILRDAPADGSPKDMANGGGGGQDDDKELELRQALAAAAEESEQKVEKPVEKAADKAPAPVQSTDKPPVKSAEIDNLFSEFDAVLKSGTKGDAAAKGGGYSESTSKPAASTSKAEKKDMFAEVDDFLKELDGGRPQASVAEHRSLDDETRRYLEGLPADLKCEVLYGFHPKDGKQDPGVQIRRFTQSIADKQGIVLPPSLRLGAGTATPSSAPLANAGGLQQSDPHARACDHLDSMLNNQFATLGLLALLLMFDTRETDPFALECSPAQADSAALDLALEVSGEIFVQIVQALVVLAADGYPRAIRSTPARRNAALRAQHGNAEKAAAEALEEDCTEELRERLLRLVPIVGLPSSLLYPLWKLLRRTCLVASIFGHDLQQESVLAEVLLAAAGLGATPAGERRLEMAAKALWQRIAGRWAKSLPVAALLAQLLDLQGMADDMVLQHFRDGPGVQDFRSTTSIKPDSTFLPSLVEAELTLCRHGLDLDLVQNSCRPGSAILDVPSHKYFSSDFRPELDPEPTLADFLQLLREAGRQTLEAAAGVARTWRSET
eukprot:s2893_g7.t2